MDAPALAEAFELAALCAPKDEMRPTLTGVALFFQEGSDLEVVATDSYRLGALRVSVTDLQATPDCPPLVPARLARALAQQLKKGQGTGGIALTTAAD